MASDCPTPNRTAYDRARDVKKDGMVQRRGMIPYPCSCGKWHAKNPAWKTNLSKKLRNQKIKSYTDALVLTED